MTTLPRYDEMLFPNKQHLHTFCLSRARKRLDERAHSNSKKLGVNDKLVFEILLSEHRSFSAYEVVDQAARNEKRLQANEVYRSVETLVKLGVAHRVELKNGYMACHSPDKCAAQQILICNSCNQVAELEQPGLNKALNASVIETGFVPEKQKLELLGTCPNCITNPPTENGNS